jgi:hypothetical protein
MSGADWALAAAAARQNTTMQKATDGQRMGVNFSFWMVETGEASGGQWINY